MHRCLAGLVADVDRYGRLGEPDAVLGLELQLGFLGAYSLENLPDGPLEHPLALTLRIRSSTRGWPELAVQGRIDAAGLASTQPIAGQLRVRGRDIVLALDFDGDQGERCQLMGSTTLRVRGIPPEFTKIDAELSVAGARRGRAHLRLDVRSNLGSALRSLRLVPSQPEG